MNKLQIAYLLESQEQMSIPESWQKGTPQKRIIPTSLEQQQMEEALSRESSLMKERILIWYKQELQERNAMEGYRCFWTRSCTRTIKGKGNFKKHLLWHHRCYQLGFEKLIQQHPQWPCLKDVLTTE